MTAPLFAGLSRRLAPHARFAAVISRVAGWAWWWKDIARHPARTVVILLCVAIVGILWTGVLVQVALDRDLVIERRQLENDNLTKVFAENITRIMRAADITLNEMASAYQRHGKAFDLVEYAKSQRIHLDPATVLSILDETGDLILASIPPPRKFNFRDASDFQFNARNDVPDIFISEPRLGATTKRWTVYLSRRINKADGSFGGSAVYGLDPTYLARIYSDIDPGADSIFNVIGRDGIMRARVDVAGFTAGQSLATSALFTRDLAVADRGHFIRKGTLDQVSRLFSYRTLKDYPLVVLIGTSEAAALAPHETRKTLYLEAASSITAVVFFFGLFATSMIARAERASERQRRSEERYVLAEQATHDGIWDWNVATNEGYRSPRWKALLGFAEDELENTAAEFYDRLHPADRQKVRDALEAHYKGDAPYAQELRLRHRDGSHRWFLSRGEVLRDAAGRPVRMVGSTTDITERKLAEERLQRSLAEKETLLREIHHRVKNNLQIISSLLYFQAMKIKNPEDLAAITDGRERLHAMILVHEKLYLSNDLSRIQLADYVQSLSEQLSRAYVPRDRRIATRVVIGDDALPIGIALPIEIALPCGMIVCELLINAFKYAFPDGSDGDVTIHVAGADGRLAITVSDNGVGLPEGFASGQAASFGWQLINALATQLGGTVAVARGAGTTVTVSFPYREAAP